MKVTVKGRVHDTEDDITLDSFRERKLSALVKVPIITIYNSPKDYKGLYIARLWDIDRPGRQELGGHQEDHTFLHDETQ